MSERSKKAPLPKRPGSKTKARGTTTRSPSEGPVTRRKRQDDLKVTIADAQLTDAALTQIMLHCATILSARRTGKSRGKTSFAASGLCYRSTGGNTSDVSLWQDGFPLGQRISLAEAQTRHIPACG